MAVLEREYSLGSYVPVTDRKFPLQDPLWNNIYAAQRRQMGDLQNLIIKRIRESVPRFLSVAKAFDVATGKI
jgi:hypothetical protein